MARDCDGRQSHGGEPALVRPTGEENPMRKWMPLIAVCLGTFMLLVDVTIVTVALPDMAADLVLGAAVVGAYLRADPGRAAAGHGLARRPVRPAAALPRRPRSVRAGLARQRPGPQHGRADRRPRRPGGTRRRHVRHHDRAAQLGLPGPGSRGGL